MKTKKYVLQVATFILTMCWSGLVFAQAFDDRPKVVVTIVVDQLRNEYLPRFYDGFGEGGFKRLLGDGYYFSNVHYNYLPTYTAPGHATIHTGTTPNTHGIVGNYWYDAEVGESVYCTEDENCPIVGGDGKGMSCGRLATTTISDEIKMATNERAKVFGVSIKDRSAILPAGHFGDAAYWMSDEATFISSRYYIDALPKWVGQFNEEVPAAKYIRMGWDKSKGASFDASLPDDNDYESLLGGKDRPVFPYDLTSFTRQGGLASIKTTPYGNDLVVDFTERLIENEGIGKDEIMDFLSVSFSSTDYVGHAMGTRAVELQDTYIRLDKSIERLLGILDNVVGKGDYLVLLTSDHGAAEVPKYLYDRKYYVTSLERHEVKDQLKDYSMEKYGENVVKVYSNFNAHLNDEVINNLKLNRNDVVEDLREYFMSLDFVQRVYTKSEVLNCGDTDYYLKMIFNGYDPKQCGDLVVLYKPGYIEHSNVGTTHGSPYAYDTNVPVIWHGWGIPKGRSVQKYNMTSLATTLAQLIQVGLPSGSRGDVMTELFD